MLDIRSLIQELIYVLPAVVISLSAHEFAHAFISYKLGDVTQKEKGRMSLNPLRHLDPIGTLSLIFFRFGWAKPVEVNPNYYKNKKEGMMWSALAGPIMNFILAFLCVFLFGLMYKFNLQSLNVITNYIFTLLIISAQINVGLGLFNLIPIPPLDGSKVLMGILKEETYFKLMRYENYFMIVIVLVLASGTLNGPLIQTRETILNWFTSITSLLLGMG